MDDDSLDKENDTYKQGESKVKDLECLKTTIEIFLECNEEDVYAKIATIHKDFDNFLFQVVPLNIADLFEEKILKIVNRAVENGEEIPVKPEFLASFYSGACLNVVTKWLQGGMPLTADELIGNLNTLLSLSHIH